jgi:hypothetical protein
VEPMLPEELIQRIRRISYDKSLSPDEALREIRDEIGIYEGRIEP